MTEKKRLKNRSRRGQILGAIIRSRLVENELAFYCGAIRVQCHDVCNPLIDFPTVLDFPGFYAPPKWNLFPLPLPEKPKMMVVFFQRGINWH